MYVCLAGHLAIKKTKQRKKNVGKNQVITHYFDVEKCKKCLLKQGGYKQEPKTKSYSISLKLDFHKVQMEFKN